MTAFGGAGNAGRTIRLLWRGEESRPGSRRGRRPSLTLGSIVATAVAIADESGAADVQIRAVAARLGCSPMALYTHVADKRELLDLMYDGVHGELEPPAGKDWRSRASSWARGLLELYVRHPWVREVSLARPVLGPNEQLALERLLEALEPGRLATGDVVAIASALFGLARTAAGTIHEARASSRTRDEFAWWQARSSALAAAAPDFEVRFPHSAALGRPDVAPTERPDTGDAPFLEGAARTAFTRAVDLLLEGAATRAARSRSQGR